MKRRAKTVSFNEAFSPCEYEERLVYARTEDGLELRGMLIRPSEDTAPSSPLLLWIHTRQLGFAEHEYVRIGRLLAARGYHFLTIETRGHDFGSWYRTADGPLLQGSAWERFTDCVHDIDAWLGAARATGYESYVLMGHGFGGAKALLFQAQRQLPQVDAIVLASSGSSVRDKLPPGKSEMARRMVEEGRGMDLLPWNSGSDNYASTVSAEYYLSRAVLAKEIYGTADLPPAIARVRCPVVAWFGREEERPNRKVVDFVEWLSSNAVMSRHFESFLIDGLGFFYNGKEDVVVRHLVGALERIGLIPERKAQRA